MAFVKTPSSQGNKPALLVRLTVASLNDLHGHLAAHQVVSGRRKPAGRRRLGGAAALAGYISLLRAENPGGVLLLDAGDSYSGSFVSDRSFGQVVVKFYNHLGLSAQAVGNHEFDFGKQALLALTRAARYPFLSANLLRLDGKRPAWARPSLLTTLKGIKIGVIGLTTLSTPYSTQVDNFQGLKMIGLVRAFKAEAARLRAQGARVIIALAHEGTVCKDLKGSPRDLSRCEPEGEAFRFARALPERGADLIVAGHTHRQNAHLVNGIPVIQTIGKGRAVAVVDLFYNRAQKRIDHTRTMFRPRQRLFHDRPGGGAMPWMSASAKHPAWLAVKLDLARAAGILNQPIGVRAVRPIRRSRSKSSGLGNMVTDAIREAGAKLIPGVTMALVNSGSLRRNIPAGPITNRHIFELYPFRSKMAVLKLTGKQLWKVLEIGTSGAHGIMQVSGLRLVYDSAADPCCTHCRVGGKIIPALRRRLVSATLEKGQALNPRAIYLVATSNYIASGSGHIYLALKDVPREAIKIFGKHLVREEIRKWLKGRSMVNGLAHPLVIPKRPRIHVLNGGRHVRCNR